MQESEFLVSFNEIKNRALDLLSRREHSAMELRTKLKSKNFPENLIAEVLQYLSSHHLQSDARFAESYLRMRMNRGYGPLRIYAELRERGVNEEIIAQHLDFEHEIWKEKISAAYRKKFGNKKPKDFTTRAKQMRFLQYRGFSFEQIGNLMKDF